MTYWEAFSFDYELDDRGLFNQLVEIEAHRLAVSKLVYPSQWREDLATLNILRMVHGTTAIEGNTLTGEEVEAQFRRSQPANREQRQVANARCAYQWIEKRFQPSSAPVSLNDIPEVHRLLTVESDEEDNVPGRMREGGITIRVGSETLGGVHYGAPGGQPLRQLMDEYIAFLNSSRMLSQNLVIRALLAHWQQRHHETDTGYQPQRSNPEHRDAPF